METPNQNFEHESAPKDISEEFKNLPWHEFHAGAIGVRSDYGLLDN